MRASAERAETADIIPHGWRETVVSVSDLEEMVAHYTGVLKWEVRSRGDVQAEQLSAWNLEPQVSATYALVANPGSQKGYVRIIQFENVEQVRIRDHDQAWETGGIYNMNIRVTDMARTARTMTDLGWQGASAPVQFTFGPFLVWEWIARNKDGVRIAISERVKPALTAEDWPHLKTSSRTFNSTQIVADMQMALDFYQGVLGFKMYLEHRGASDAAGEHVLGLSHQAMTEIMREVYIVNPYGDVNDGSIELLEFENYSGRDFSKNAVPPNLGNLMLRYPVPSVDKLATYLESQGINLQYPPLQTTLAPYGRVKIMAIRSPEGAWLEFYEEL